MHDEQNVLVSYDLAANDGLSFRIWANNVLELGDANVLLQLDDELRVQFDVVIEASKLQPLDSASHREGQRTNKKKRADVVFWAPDGKHVKKVLKELGLEDEGAKGSGVTGARATLEDRKLKERLLDDRSASWYRSMAATLNYMAMERPNLGFAVKELCCSMRSPSELDLINLKKAGRYLKDNGSASFVCGWNVIINRVDGFSDSDFAGSEKRTSTTGGVILIGGTVIKSWSKQQKVVALSSGEAELYAAVKLGCELMGIKSLAKDLGIEVQLHLYIDAKATFGMLTRKGVGSMKHVETNQFWLQDFLSRRKLCVFTKCTRTTISQTS